MEQGERAIRAHLQVTRAAAKKASSLNEAVSNRMDKVLARSEGASPIQSEGWSYPFPLALYR